MNEIKVSVCITTYNQQEYIAQALDSVMMQEVDFDYEILVGEDESTDGTRAIIQEYESKYPDKFRVFYHTYSLDYRHVNGRRNFANNIENARGQYIALLDGDDFWTDPFKLQKQVGFLDTHPEFSACFHDANILVESDPTGNEVFHFDRDKKAFTLEDILSSFFIPTCSTVFRSSNISSFPKWFYKAAMGDWPLHIMNAQRGPYYYLDENMASYRIHSSGIWSRQSHITKLHKTAKTIRLVNAQLGYKYNSLLRSHCSKINLSIANLLLHNNRFLPAIYYAVNTILLSSKNRQASKNIIRESIKRIYHVCFSPDRN